MYKLAIVNSLLKQLWPLFLLEFPSITDVAIKKQLQVANVKLKDYREKEKKLFKGAFSE